MLALSLPVFILATVNVPVVEVLAMMLGPMLIVIALPALILAVRFNPLRGQVLPAVAGTVLLLKAPLPLLPDGGRGSPARRLGT